VLGGEWSVCLFLGKLVGGGREKENPEPSAQCTMEKGTYSTFSFIL
jgi:hypothetical protein